MFLSDINVVDVDICVQEKDKFVAHTRASVDICEVMPYLNAMIRGADYNREAGSIKFLNNKIEFTIIHEQINIAKFINRTELHELLDWVQDLINDVYMSMAELTPRYDTRKRMPPFEIYAMLPKTNCQKCGEKSCMVFAAKLSRLEVEVDDCPNLSEQGNMEKKRKLESAFS
jgi:ArsR family metal-binding transcriptional regulator